MSKNNFILGNSHIITVHRGDTFIAPIFINKGTLLQPVRYYLQSTDKVYVGITEPHQYFEHAIIKKVYDFWSPRSKEKDVLFTLEPSDTEFLVPGKYYYEVKLYQIDECGREFVSTVVDKSLFYVVE